MFPTHFRLNTKGDIAALIPDALFERYIYYLEPEPGYHFARPFAYRAMMVASSLLPKPPRSNLFVFIHKVGVPE